MQQRTHTAHRLAKLLFLLAALLIPLLLAGRGADAQAPVPSGAQPPAPPTPHGAPATVLYSLKNDLSPALRDLPPQQAPQNRARSTETAVYPLPRQAAGERAVLAQPDGAWQQAAGGVQMPLPQFLFSGLSNDDNNAVIGGYVAPPDTAGAVGPNHYVQWVNLVFKIWQIDRATNTATPVYGPAAGNSLWAGFGGACEFQNNGDIIVLFDRLANRWLMSQFAIFAPDGNHQCVAISQTDDPTGAWYRYDFLASPTKLNDYPKIGVWPDGYYMSANQFDQSFNWGGQGAWVFERSRMLVGEPARMIYFDLFSRDPIIGGMLPADLDGAEVPPNTPNYFVTFDDDGLGAPSDRLQVWAFTTDWATPGNSTFVPADSLAVAPFNSVLCPTFRGQCVPQPDGTFLESLSDRLMYRLQYRSFGDHQALVVNHAVDADGSGRAGVRWYELRKSGGPWTVHQQGTYAPADGLHRWMGSAALDRAGNLAIGYSVAGTSTYPGIRYAGRLADDPRGILPQGEVETAAGVTSQAGTARWGDYSMLTLDPLDDCTFWFTTEYVAGPSMIGFGNWATQVASFRFPTCTAGPVGAVEGVVTAAGGGSPLAGARIVLPNGIQTVTDDAGRYRISSVPVGTYAVTAKKFGYIAATQPDVVVAESQTAVVDFALAAASLVEVSGAVRDGVQNWPLYARIEISTEDFTQVLFTDPFTGQYNLSLVQGADYQFEVQAFSQGYLPAVRNVTLIGAATENFALLPDPSQCVAPGYSTAGGGCDPLPGGLVAGNVYDDNTATALNGATVSADIGSVKTVATPEDAAVADGFYILFAASGPQPISATRGGGYGTSGVDVFVIANAVTKQDFWLPAAQLILEPDAIAVELGFGETAARELTVRNIGSLPADFALKEQGGPVTPFQPQPGAPLLRINRPVFTGPRPQAAGVDMQRPMPRPNVPPWTNVAPYPTNIMDSATAVFDGKVYSVGGYDGFSTVASLYIYDPATDSWSAGANMLFAREKPAAAFVDGRLYVVGGWNNTDGAPVAALEIYDPATNTWHSGATLPDALAAAGGVQLDGAFYVIGGCGSFFCGSAQVYRYDPPADAWTAVAPYPGPISWQGCGAIGGQILCAGGTDGMSDSIATYAYDPAADTWTRKADMPTPVWGAAAAAANQRLWIVSGVNMGSLINTVYAYDPLTDTWSSEANVNQPTYRGGGACGLYKVGGSIGGFSAVNVVERYPDLADCGEVTDVPWLRLEPTEGALNPGLALPVAVTLDASALDFQQPGIYQAKIIVAERTPYVVTPVAITMTVAPPASWGVVAGQVTGLGYCDSNPGLVDTANLVLQGQSGDSIAVRVDSNGRFRTWLDSVQSPYVLTAEAPQHATAQIAGIGVSPQMTTTADVGLRLLAPCISVEPTSIGITMVPGEIVARTLTLRNAGAGEATYRIGEVEMLWAAAARTQAALQGGRAVNPGEAKDLVAAQAAVGPARPRQAAAAIQPARSGGPDEGGYTFRDSRELTGPAYSWVEIAPPAGGSGVEIEALTGADDAYYWPIELPFAFPFYDKSYTQVAVSANGVVYFDDKLFSYFNLPIPGWDFAGVGRFIALFWDDMVVDPGAVYYQDFGQFVVIEYYQVSGLGPSPDPGTWQVILFPTGSVLMQYQDVNFGDGHDQGGSATIGIQGQPWAGLEYSFDSFTLSNRLAICYAPRGQTPTCRFDVPWLSEQPEAGVIPPDATAAVQVGFDASLPQTNQPGDYDAKLVVASNDAFVSPLTVPVRMSVVTPAPTATPTPTASPTPTQTPTATPTPTKTPEVPGEAVAEIDPTTGGRLNYRNPQGQGVVVDVPAGAVNAPFTLVYSTESFPGGSVPNMVFAGMAFQLRAFVNGQPLENVVFTKPVKVSVIYDPAAVAGLRADEMALYVADGSKWVDAATSCSPASTYVRDTTVHKLETDICHLSYFALFAGGNRLYMPDIAR